MMKPDRDSSKYRDENGVFKEEQYHLDLKAWLCCRNREEDVVLSSQLGFRVEVDDES